MPATPRPRRIRRRTLGALRKAVSTVMTEPLERRMLLTDNTTLATARDIDPLAVNLQHGAQRMAVFNEPQDTGSYEYYRFTLAAGEQASISLAGQDTNLDLLGAGGTVLATSIDVAGSLGSELIVDYVAGSAGTYYVRAYSDTTYDLIVTRDATIETGSGLSAGSAQDITQTGQVLGYFDQTGEIDFTGIDRAWLTENFDDAENFDWDIYYDGSIEDGTDDAFDGGLVHVGFPRTNYGVYEEDYEEIVLGPYQYGNVSVARKIYVPEESAFGFARFLEIVTNNGASAVTHTLTIRTDLGSDAATQLVATSSGGTTVSVDDDWIVTDDADNAGDPSIVHVFAGPGGVRPSAVTLSGDELSFSYDLTLQPGETRVIMHFAAQSRFRAAAIAKAQQIAALAGGVMKGTTAAEQTGIVNFQAGGDSDFYKFNANAGDTLSITTMTLDSEVPPGQELDLLLELYDPSGSLVASNDNGAPDGRNAVISHTAAPSGQYTVRVRSLLSRRGQYSLAVQGATGETAGPEVTGTDIAPGATVNAFPTFYQVTFAGSLRTGSAVAGALTINGVAATSASLSGNTISFNVAAAGSGNGAYSVTLAPGAATDLAGNPTQGFTTTFSVEGADLVVTNATGPSAATHGQNISLSWTVQNQGIATTFGGHGDYIYISDDPVFGGADQFIANNFTTQPLAPGESYNLTQNLVLPASINAGTRYLLFLADLGASQPEANDNNNVFALPITITAPDLAMTAATAPSTIVVGQNFTVDWTVQNQSDLATVANTSWFDYIYFSSDAVFGTGDLFLTNTVRSNPVGLAPGESYSATRTFSAAFSGQQISGPGFLLFVANGAGNLGETTRANNTFAVPVTLEAPDLTVTAATAPPTAAFGELTPVSWTVQNVGSVAASVNWFDQIYLSVDNVFGSGDFGLISSPATAAIPLDPQESHTFSTSFAIPSHLVGPGDYFLIFRANAFGIGESSRTNNDFAVPITLQAPDITVTSATVPPTLLTDQYMDVSWTVQNVSGLPAAADWYDAIYLSRDTILNDNDDERLTDRWAGDETPLAPGASYTGTSQVYIDAWDVSAGQWYMIFVADAFRSQRETNEANNNFVVPVIVDMPDLVVSDVIAPAVVDHNQSISLSWTVTNTSTSATAQFAGDDYIVISDDPFFDWEDYFLDDFWPGSSYPLEPGESYTATMDVTIWPDVPAGEKYLLIIADGDEDLGEANENNNVRAIPITINGPDMAALDFVAPPAVILSQPVSFSWTVENAGAFPALWSWRDGVFLSDDAKYNPEKDTFVGSQFFSNLPLDPGQQYTLNPTLTIPTSALGERYLLLVVDYAQWQGETSRANNIIAVPVTVSAPDLTVSGGTAPTSAVVGSSISVSWDATNIGLHAALASWSDRVYLSTDPIFSGDLQLGSFSRPSTLEPEATYTQTRNVLIPANTAPGSMYLIFFADADSRQGETNESNNYLAIPITLSAPDLTVTSITGVPPIAILGSSFDVSWTVQNIGAFDALQTSWNDSIYISSDTVLDTSDTFVDRESRSHSLLAAGASYTATEGVTLPATATGNRFLLVVTDRFQAGSSSSNNRQGETNENNNTLAIPIELIATDLVVTASTAPASAATNQPIDISFTVLNQGTTPAPAEWEDALFLSTDGTLSGGDIRIEDWDADEHSPLPAGGSYSVSGQVTLPAANAGNYFLLFVADEGNDQGETNESNNVRSQAIAITNPDLAPVALVAPALVSAGQLVEVSWTVTNPSSVIAWADWYDSVYLSTDSVLGSNDIRVMADSVSDVSPLDEGASYTRTHDVFIPSSVAAGEYNLIVATDRLGFGSFDLQHNNKQRETSESNNELAVPITVGVPDLVLESFTAPPSASQDEQIALSWTVRNDGDGTTVTQWYDEVYLSSDEALDESDVLLVQRVGTQGTIPSGESYTESVNVSVPPFQEGPAFLLLRVDRYNHQAETDETNNDAVAAIAIGSKDLAVSNVSGPPSAAAGDAVSVSWTVTNHGSVAVSGTWTDRVLLSDDADIGFDTLLAEFSITTTIPAGQSIARTQSVTIPEGLSGTFRFVVHTDAGSQIGEGNESNNASIAADPIVVSTALRPNLQVSNISLAVGEVELGEAFTVHWSVLNTGDDATSSSFWRDYVFLSADQTLDDTDLRIGDVQNPSFLNAGEGYSTSTAVSVSGVSEGDYYILVKTDATSPHRVSESDEGDNVLAGPQIHITLPPPPDMRVTSVQAPEIAFSGQPMAVTYHAVNFGPGQVLTGSWHDRIYLSTDEQLDSGDHLLGTFTRLRSASLSDSALVDVDYTATYSPSLPVGVTGTFYVFVLTDATNRIDEFAFELNNSNYDATPVTVNLTPPPDLEVEQLDVHTPAASAGRPFALTYRVFNNGATGTPNTSWKDAFFLSTDNQFDPATDLRIGTEPTGFSLGLDAGDGYEKMRTVTTPADLAPGDYYLFAVADVDNVVFELDNANNVGLPIQLTVISEPADLQVIALEAPLVANAGQVLTLNWSVLNSGVGDTIARSWTDEVYLSFDETIGDADDRRLGSFGHSGLLDPGFGYEQGVNVQIPWDVAGSMRIYVRTDAGDRVFEGDGESNNTSAPALIDVTLLAADLEVSNASLAEVGGRLRFNWTVFNLGPGITSVPWWYDAVYISADAVFGNGDDVLLKGIYHGGRLNVDGGYSAAATLDIPRSFNGVYHFFVEADSTQLVSEGSARANNVVAAGSFDTATLRIDPDFIVHAVSAPATATAGQDVTIDWTVRNVGDAIPQDGPRPPELSDDFWRDNVYLSRDQVFDPESDIFLGQALTHRSALRPLTEGDQSFQQYERSATFIMPRGQTGTFYVFVLADKHANVAESNETNNMGSDLDGMVTNLAPPADLTVGMVTIPSNATVGSSFSVSYTLENLGPANVLGSWSDRLYLSTDDAYSLDDIPLAVRSHSTFLGDGFIPAGGSETYFAGGRLTAAVPGDYYVVLRTDVYNAVNEVSELNNFGASLTSFTLSVPTLDLADGDDSFNVRSFTFYGAPAHTEFFAFNTQEGQTIALDGQWNFIDFDPLDPDFRRSSRTTVYVAHDRIPSPFDYDFAEDSLLFSMLHTGVGNRLVIPRTEQGTYYVRVDVRDTTFDYTITGGGVNHHGSHDDMDVVVSVLPFSISQVNPGRVGNSGLSTFEVVASDFGLCTDAHLLLNGQVLRSATDIHLDADDQSRGFVTFDTRGLNPGNYQLRLTGENGESDVEDLTITAGTGPNIGATADGPAAVRANREYVFYVNYANNGDSDGYAPLILIENLDSNRFSTSHAELRNSPNQPRTIQVLGISHEGPAGILRSGALNSIPVYFVTDGATGNWRVSTIAADDPRPIDFDVFADEIRPASVDDSEWSEVLPRLQALIGTTWGGYVMALSNMATELASSGFRTFDMHHIFEALYLKARLGIKNPIAQGVVVGEPQCVVVPGAAIEAIGADGRVAETVVTDDQSRFRFRELTPGIYDLVINGEGYARKFISGVEVLADGSTRLRIHLDAEAIIAGSIDASALDPEDDEFLFVAQAIGQTSAHHVYEAEFDGDQFAISNVPAGTYDLRIRTNGFLVQTIRLTIDEGQSLDLGTITLTPAAAISGGVTHATGSELAAGMVVGAYNSTGNLVASAILDENDGFSFRKLEAGAYTLRLVGMETGFSSEALVIVTEGQQFENVALTIQPGATISGTVTDTQGGQPVAGVLVRIVGADGARVTRITNSDGQYSFEGIGLGDYTLELGVTGPQARGSVSVSDLQGAYSVNLAFAAAAAISGRLTLSDGTPVEGGQVQLLSGDETVAIVNTDADGNYALHLLQGGTYSLRAGSRYGGASFTPTGPFVIGNGQTHTQDFVAGTGSVHASFSLAETAVVALSQIIGGQSVPLSVVSASGGVVNFAHLALGQYEISVAAGRIAGTAGFTVSNSAVTSLTVPLSLQATLAGTISDGSGAGIGEAVIVLTNPGTGVRYMAAALGDGSYSFPRVANGTYDVVVFAAGKTPVLHSGVAISGEAHFDQLLDPSAAVLSGRVVDAAGRSLREASVTLLDSAQRVIGMTRLEADGTFVIDAAGSNLTLKIFAAGFTAAELTNLSSGDVGDIAVSAVAITVVPPQTEPNGLGSFGGGMSSMNSELRPTFTEAFFSDYQPAPAPTLGSLPSPVPIECVAQLEAAEAMIQELQSLRQAILNNEDYFDDLKVEFVTLLALESVAAIGKAAEVGIAIYQITGMLAGSIAQLSTSLGSQASAMASAAQSAAAQFLGNAQNALGLVQQALGGLSSSIQSATEAGQGASTSFSNRVAAISGLITDIFTNLNTVLTFLSMALERLVQGAGNVASSALGNAGNLLSAISAVNTVIQLVDGDGGEFFKESLRVFDQMTTALADTQQSVLQYEQKLAQWPGVLQALLDCIDEANDDDGDDDDGDGDGDGDGDSGANPPGVPTPPPSPTDPFPYDPPPVASSDPNDIVGPRGFGEEGWIGARSVLPYMIRFENQAEATAPAQRVTITHQLDSDLDFRTFRVDDFGWGDLRIELPGNAGFHQSRVDLPDSMGFDVDVTVSIDTITGLATWILQAVDPATGEAPADALLGFLPPNDENGAGEGFVTYTIKAKREVPSGTRIDAQATIVFDTNEPIDTPPIFNTLDGAAPQSSINALPAQSDSASFLVSWAGTDDDGGSGISSFDIYVSTGGGPFTLWLGGTELNEAMFDGVGGRSYAFYSIARDHAGNFELPPSVADAQTVVSQAAGIAVSIGGNASISEGDVLTRNGSFTDATADGPYTVTIDYGDGSLPQVQQIELAGAFSLNHGYAEDGQFTITVTVQNSSGVIGGASFNMVVENVAPAVDAGPDESGNEGGAVLFSGSFTDPGVADTHTILWDFGDGATASGTLSPVHAYADNGTYTATLTITDDDGSVTSDTLTVTVSNVAPTAVLSNSGPVSEGEQVTVIFSGEFDPSAADTAAGFIYSFDFDNDGVFEVSGTSPSATHTFADTGQHTVNARIADKDGDFTQYSTIVVVEAEGGAVAPSFTALSATSPVGEGATVTLSGSFIDPNADDTFTVLVDWGDGTVESFPIAAGIRSFEFTHAYADDPAGGDAAGYTINVTLTDSADLSASTSTTVVVNNIAPVLADVIATPASAGEDEIVTISGSILEPGAHDALTVAIDWGDGSAPEISNYAAGSTSFSQAHTYAQAGSYSIVLTITDDDGASTQAQAQVEVLNAAPTATFGNSGPVDEGESVSISFTDVSDSDADLAAGLTYEWDLDNDGIFELNTTQASITHTFTASGTFIVRGRIYDVDGAFSEYTTDVVVDNLAPTATFGNSGPIDEGQQVTLSFTDQSDSDADMATGFTYEWDLDNDGVFELSTSEPSIARTLTASGSHTVRGRIIDAEGAFSEYTTEIVVNDVAPTIAIFGESATDEGGSYQITLGEAFDPGDDVITGYTVHWGDGNSETFTGSPNGAVHSHVFSDGPAARSIRIDIVDGDGAHTGTGELAVSVQNVVPTAVFAGVSADESAPAAIGFSGQFDPSADDTAPGFRYSFDLNNDGDFDDEGEVEDAIQADWSVTFPENGSYTVRGRIEDKDGGFSDYTTTLTITNVAPSADIIGAPAAATEGDLISLSSLVLDPGALDTFTYAWNVTKDGVLYSSGTDADFDFTPDDQGTYVVSLTVTDDDGGIGVAEARTITVANADPLLDGSSATATAQYTDAFVPVMFVASDPGDDVLSATAQFSSNGGSTFGALPPGISLLPGTEAGQWLIAGTANLAPGTYVIRVNVSDGEGGSALRDVALTVNREDAAADYTGAMYVATASTRSGQATVLLAATVRDSVLTDAADTTAGDVRKAKVTFYVYNAMTDALVATISNVAVGLVTPGDTLTGTAVYEWATDIGSNDALIYRVVAMVGDHYVGSSAGDLVTVTKQGPGSINGGGYLINTASGGIYAGDAGQRTSFAFNVKANKGKGTPQGNVVVRVRRMEADGLLHTYEIRSNAILSVVTNPSAGTATFEARATIKDVTDPLNVISIDGNALLRITLQDGGNLAADRIGATLWNKDGGLYFSSLWDGIRTLEDELEGGNIGVH